MVTRSLERVDAGASTQAMIAAIERDGAVVVEQMVDRVTINTMRDAIVRHALGVDPGSRDRGLWPYFHGVRTKRFTHLGRLSPAFFDLLANPTMAAISDATLLPQCGSYWLNTAQAMLIGPGEPAQVLHRDATNWAHLARMGWPAVPEITISAMIALDATRDELGATRVIPGSHRWSDAERGDAAASVPVELEPGSALVYSGKVLHGGGANATKNEWPNAMPMSFVLGWLSPEDANAMQYDPDEIAHLPDRSKRLPGFSSYDPSPHAAGRLWLKDFDAWSV